MTKIRLSTRAYQLFGSVGFGEQKLNVCPNACLCVVRLLRAATIAEKIYSPNGRGKMSRENTTANKDDLGVRILERKESHRRKRGRRGTWAFKAKSNIQYAHVPFSTCSSDKPVRREDTYIAHPSHHKHRHSTAYYPCSCRWCASCCGNHEDLGSFRNSFYPRVHERAPVRTTCILIGCARRAPRTSVNRKACTHSLLSPALYATAFRASVKCEFRVCICVCACTIIAYPNHPTLASLLQHFSIVETVILYATLYRWFAFYVFHFLSIHLCAISENRGGVSHPNILR